MLGNEIAVYITRKEDVSSDAIARISSEFLEWIEQEEGGEINLPKGVSDTYEELGKRFSKFLTDERNGQL